MILLVQLFVVASVLLLLSMPWVAGGVVVSHLRTRRHRQAMFVASALAVGLYAGAFAAWTLLLPSGWNLSFLATVKASVDSATYGHPVEHAAENLLVFMLFASVLCGTAAGGAAALAMHFGRLRPGA